MILIVPYGNKERACGRFARYVPQSVPFGVGMLAGYLVGKGKNVAIVDECVSGPLTEETLKESILDMKKPYIFGISCVTAGIGRGYTLASLIKKVYPKSKVIMGGIHPTVLPDEVLDRKTVDIAVRGEGEETLDALYEALKEGHDYSQLKGISFIDGEGQIKHNEAAPLLADLNTVPQFPYQLFEKNSDRYNFGFLMASRGCPHECIFCSQRKISGKRYRFIDPEKIMEEVKMLNEKYGVKFFNFYDDDLIVNKKWIKDFCKLVDRFELHKKKIRFSCNTRGDSITEEILGILKKAGFIHLDIGLETATERLMKLLKKGESVSDVVRAVKLAKKFKFSIGGVFIVGLPTETKEERHATFKMAKDLPLDYVRFNNACPYPGTELFNMAKKENRLKVEPNWSNFTSVAALVGGFKLPYVPPGCSEEELKKEITEANSSFFLTPKRIFGLLFSGKHWFSLPKMWYLKPKEWINLAKLGIEVLFPSNKKEG